MVDEQDIRARIGKYPWYHIIPVTDEISTPGWEATGPNVAVIRGVVRSLDLKGKRFLDIGCRDGLFCFEAEKLGAGEVIGIDSDLSRGATEFLIPFFKSRVRMHQLNVLALRPETFGRFDVVLCAAVLNHLRYPAWCLKRVRDVLKDDGTLVLETPVVRDDSEYPLLYCPVGEESPYDATSCTFYNVKGLTDTLLSLGISVESTEFLDKRPRWRRAGPQPPQPPSTLGLRERLAAIWGKPPRPAPPPPPPASPRERLAALIDRAVMLCRYRPALINTFTDPYWHGTHTVHTRAG
jgi:SAM-dependent methyltransferase